MAMWMDGLAARWSASWLAPLRRKLRISLAFLLCATGLSPAWASFTPPFEYAFSWSGNSEPRGEGPEVHTGDLVLFTGFGGGFTWGSILFRNATRS